MNISASRRASSIRPSLCQASCKSAARARAVGSLPTEGVYGAAVLAIQVLRLSQEPVVPARWMRVQAKRLLNIGKGVSRPAAQHH
jgi:hypothetical protein